MTMDNLSNSVSSIEELGKAKGFKLLHTNVHSLTKKMDQVKIMFEGKELDVITMSETWLNNSVSSNSLTLQGYVTYRQDRNLSVVTKKRGGGLLTYVATKHATDCEYLPDISKSSADIEAQWLIIYSPKCRNILICNVYRPPNGNVKKAIDYLDECLVDFDLERTDVFIMGDMNINYLNRSSLDFKKLQFFARSNSLTQEIQSTTRNSDKSKSLLDLILTNSKYVNSVGTLDHFISDHQPIYVIKKKKRDHRPSTQFEGRSYRNFDVGVLRERLLDHDWAYFYTLTDPNDAWKYILDQFTPVIDQMCPIRLFHIKNYRPDWVTHELLEQIKDRDYFYKKAKQTGSQDDWNIAKHLRNTTNANIRQARRDFIHDELDSNKSDYKKFWKTIRSVIPNDKTSSKQNILLTDEGKKVPAPQVAHFINNFFINVGKTNGKTVDDLKSDPVDVNDETESDPPKWSFAKFMSMEVFKVVKSINVSKSSGLTNISSLVVKEVFTILLEQVTHLFNLTITSAIFPASWKNALVVPIPKNGNLTKVQNYRPISLLPLPGKLLEKLVHTQLSEHLDNIGYLSENQYGFRKNHSTIHSVAQLTKYINTKMDRGLPTLAVFIDFRKAFDCVQHPILLKKMTSMNLDHNVISWFESYLTGRSQRVLANEVYSPSLEVTQGVPQGSVLGPLFYMIYANDIADTVKYSQTALYADDTVLYLASPNFGRAVKGIQKDVDVLSSWCKKNGIQMNVDKIKVMTFGNKKKIERLAPFEIMVDEAPLKIASQYKYLGMTLDGQLNYDLHVQRIITNVTPKLKQFRRMRYFLNSKSAVLIYKNMILPMIEYGDIFLSGATAESRKKLQILQNKGLRCALKKDKYENVSALHTEGKISRLKHRRAQHTLSYMYDMSRNDKNLKQRVEGGVRTRSHNKRLLKIRKPNTEKFKNSLAYKGPKMWNALPEELLYLKTRHHFNAKVNQLVEKKAKAQAENLKNG